MDQRNFGDVQRTIGIQFEGQIGFIFSFINSGISGTIDYPGDGFVGGKFL